MDEFEIIDRLRRVLPHAEGALGLRDDAGLLDGWVVTTDLLVEGVHFVLGWSSPSDAGWKAAAVNLSDLAAMGAAPAALVWSVGAPAGRGEAVLEAAEGFGACAERHGIGVLGGDLVEAPLLVLAASALGRAERVVRRDGARVGDLVGISGPVGGAAAGLALLRGALGALDEEERGRLVSRHRRPEPRSEAGRALAEAGVTAMIDVSDGLGADLGHLAAESRTSIRLEEVPVDGGAAVVAEALGEEAGRFALRGGDDYELAFTFPPALRQELEGAGWMTVGRVEEGEGVWWRGERVDRLGWRHGAEHRERRRQRPLEGEGRGPLRPW